MAKDSRFIVWEEFLVFEEISALIQYCHSREADFQASQVFDPDYTREEHRRSRVLVDTGRFHNLISQRILFYLPRILRALCHPFFDVSRIESQLTASNDGDYFRMHNDNTHAGWPSREITYVYFFHREPRVFAGGELVLYDSLEREGAMPEVVPRRRIIPEQNTIIFFPSSCLHEILPVHCPSQTFADSRFTLNGWLHR